jgi:quercetin dioxygenase-like cupin family protein
MKYLIRLTVFVMVLLLSGIWKPDVALSQIDTRCYPVSQRQSEIGCYVLAYPRVRELPKGPLFWHLNTFSSRSAAEAVATSTSVVVESQGKVWLFTVAPETWRAPRGQHVAQMGPLPIPSAEEYGFMFMEAVFPPGVKMMTHKHPGPEASYVLAGERCIETPTDVTRTRAGEGSVLPGDVTMSLRTTGSEMSRALVLILHDGTQPPASMVEDWKPSGLCQ